MRESRDPELLVHTADEYADRAGRLITDPEYYRQRSQAAREIGRQRTDPGLAVDEINRVIGLLWSQRFPGSRSETRADRLARAVSAQ